MDDKPSQIIRVLTSDSSPEETRKPCIAAKDILLSQDRLRSYCILAASLHSDVLIRSARWNGSQQISDRSSGISDAQIGIGPREARGEVEAIRSGSGSTSRIFHSGFNVRSTAATRG